MADLPTAMPARARRSLTRALNRQEPIAAHRQPGPDHPWRPLRRKRAGARDGEIERIPMRGRTERSPDRIGLLLIDVANEANGHVQAIGRDPRQYAHCGASRAAFA